jgi:hypothetical protein
MCSTPDIPESQDPLPPAQTPKALANPDGKARAPGLSQLRLAGRSALSSSGLSLGNAPASESRVRLTTPTRAIS